MESSTIGPAPRDIAEILNQEQSLVFPSFTADTAWALGNALRARLAALPGPVVVSIASTNGSHLLFHTVTRGGTAPDNDAWVRRKRAAVERWGCSTWLLQNKFGGDEDAWRSKFGMGMEEAVKYAIHGGGFPVRVANVGGVVATIVVSGLKQDQDHQVIVEVVEEFLKGQTQ